MARGKHFRFSFLGLLLLAGWTGSLHAQSGTRGSERILIETSKPYNRVTDAIKARGGRVLYEYNSIDGVAAIVPLEAVDAIRAIPGVTSLDKDVNVPGPETVGGIRTVSKLKFGGIVSSKSSPRPGPPASDFIKIVSQSAGTYALNNAGTRIEKLHAKGLTGGSRIVAVIDSGIRPGFQELLGGKIVGGIDFVDDGPAGPAGDTDTDWMKDSNDGHGTFAAGLIDGNVLFGVDGVLQSALEQYAPGAIFKGKLPLIGTAPTAKIYVVRVFGNDAAAGATKSTILAAIQHVIDQRELYDRTNGRRGVKIDVANLSLGVSTLAAGRDLLDRAVDAMLKAGIVPIVSVGNTGPSSLTTASPGSSMSAVTVGGTSLAASERILNEVLYGTDFPDFYYEGIGGDLRPYSGTETAWFSSRGPNADGRLDPDVVAHGVGIIGQGYCPDQILEACFRQLSFVNGTSFSAPIVAGIAAVLRDAFPKATATEIRNALILSGRANQIAEHFDVVDRGEGLVDAYGAYQVLLSGKIEDSLPRVNQPSYLVRRNIEQNTRLEVLSGSITKALKNMKPGERGEILYEVPPQAERVIVKIRNVDLHGPQNPYYGGDAMFLYIHSAKTSSIGATGDYLVEGDPFFGGEPEVEYDFDDPDTGIMRITLNPDTLNAGLVSAEVSIETIREAWPHATFEGRLLDGESKKFNYVINPGTTHADFLLTWDHDWAHYPTSDLDMYVCNPTIPNTIADCKALGINDGATKAGPERVSVTNPAPGTWTIVVSGFSVPTGSDQFKLSITKAP